MADAEETVDELQFLDSSDELLGVLAEIANDPIFDDVQKEQSHLHTAYGDENTSSAAGELRDTIEQFPPNLETSIPDQDGLPQAESVYLTLNDASTDYEASQPSCPFSEPNSLVNSIVTSEGGEVSYPLPVDEFGMAFGDPSNQYARSMAEFYPSTFQDSHRYLAQMPSTFHSADTSFLTPQMNSQTVIARVPSLMTRVTPVLAHVAPSMTPIAVPYYPHRDSYYSIQHSPGASSSQGSVSSAASGSSSNIRGSSLPYQEINEPELTRPKEPFLHLIAQAILSSKERKMKLPEIYRWFANKHPFYRSGKGNRSSWQNRMNLQKETLMCPVGKREG